MTFPKLVRPTLLLLASQTWLPALGEQPHLEIPFKLYDGFAIVVRGSVGDQADLNFLVDSGAVPTAIHKRLARKLHLRGTPETIAVVNQSTAVQRVELPNLRLANSPLIVSVSAIAVDLTPIETRLGVRLDAVIGLDVLGRKDLTIDYRKKVIQLGVATPASEAVQIQLRERAGGLYALFPAEVNSQPVSLLLDTGTNDLTFFATSGGQPALLRGLAAEQNLNATGTHRVTRTEFLTLRIGSRYFTKATATIADSEDAAVRDFEGLLGPVALGITRIAFDFRRSTMFLEFKK